MRHQRPRGAFGIVEVVAVSAIVALFVIVLVIAIMPGAPVTKPLQEPRDIERPPDLEEIYQIYRIREGMVPGEACRLLREVLEESKNMEVKIACIQGLAHHKDFESGPLLFKIMEADDNLFGLRHNAYLATTTFLPDFFYNARAPLAQRREKVELMRSHWLMHRPKADFAGK